jgi:predicted dehydrogenase
MDRSLKPIAADAGLAADRRRFLKTGGTLAAAVTLAGQSLSGQDPAVSQQQPEQTTPQPARHRIGSIGTGSRWRAVGRNAMQFGDVVAVCDVDSRHTDQAVQIVQAKQSQAPDAYGDYRQILRRDDIDVVTIVTPDHWHAKIAIEALHAGKDVYCEKPLTLTIDQGKEIIAALESTGRVFQVGTQQRSEFNLRFLTAVALCHEGRLGKINKISCVIGSAPTSDVIPVVDSPKELDWDQWLGPAPLVDFRLQEVDKGRPPTRCHYEFRWWYEYSGGKMTDWGAHHVDIAQWALGQTDSGPVRITPKEVTHPVPLDSDGMPTDASRYNVATDFSIECEFAEGEILEIASRGRNGLLIEGDRGRIFVSRGTLEGKPVDDLATDPLPEDALRRLYKGHTPGGGNAHMRNFFECVASREQPISDVYSHHRAMTTCHLANIAMRLGRELRWDPDSQMIQDDPQARSMQSRTPRGGFEIEV